MIVNWRTLWGYEFPFYFVQLPNFMAPWQSPVEDGGWPQIRESFAKTAKEVPNTGMAITIDIGEEDRHPSAITSRTSATASAALRLHNTYGMQGFAWSGPVAESCKFAGRQSGDPVQHGRRAARGQRRRQDRRLRVDGRGRHYRGGRCGHRRQGHGRRQFAESRQPVVVHYAWANNPVGVNLANAEGLPASPFRFGEMPKFEVFSKFLPDEARAYKLVYAFDPLAGKLTDDGTRFVYDTDNSAQVKGPFKKVAYFLALREAAGAVSYAFVAMDPFTTDVAKIGVPTVASGAMFQTKVTGVIVKTNAKGVTRPANLPTAATSSSGPIITARKTRPRCPVRAISVFDFGDGMA